MYCYLCTQHFYPVRHGSVDLNMTKEKKYFLSILYLSSPTLNGTTVLQLLKILVTLSTVMAVFHVTFKIDFNTKMTMKKYSGKYVFVMFAQMFALFRMAELIKQSSSKVLPAVLEPVGSKKIQTRAHKLGI